MTKFMTATQGWVVDRLKRDWHIVGKTYQSMTHWVLPNGQPTRDACPYPTLKALEKKGIVRYDADRHEWTLAPAPDPAPVAAPTLDEGTLNDERAKGATIATIEAFKNPRISPSVFVGGDSNDESLAKWEAIGRQMYHHNDNDGNLKSCFEDLQAKYSRGEGEYLPGNYTYLQAKEAFTRGWMADQTTPFNCGHDWEIIEDNASYAISVCMLCGLEAARDKVNATVNYVPGVPDPSAKAFKSGRRVMQYVKSNGQTFSVEIFAADRDPALLRSIAPRPIRPIEAVTFGCMYPGCEKVATWAVGSQGFCDDHIPADATLRRPAPQPAPVAMPDWLRVEEIRPGVYTLSVVGTDLVIITTDRDVTWDGRYKVTCENAAKFALALTEAVRIAATLRPDAGSGASDDAASGTKGGGL